MKDICYVIKDLLPLYQEEMLSEPTKKFVEQHLPECPQCQLALQELASDHQGATPDETATALVPLQKVKRQLFRKKVFASLAGLCLALVLVTLCFSYLTARKVIPYRENLFTTEKLPNGELGFKVKQNYTQFQVEYPPDEQGKPQNIAYVSFFTTPLDEWQKRPLPQEVSASLPTTRQGEATSIYYFAQGAAPVHLAGPELNGQSVTLPRLALSSYFLSAGIFTLVMGGLAYFFRQKKLGLVSKHLAIFGLAYLLAQLAIKGFNFASDSLQWDLSLILLVALLLTLGIEALLAFLKLKAK